MKLILVFLLSIVIFPRTIVHAQSIVITPKPGTIKLPLDAIGNYTVLLNDIATITTSNGTIAQVLFVPSGFNCQTLGPQNVSVFASDANAKPLTPQNASFSYPSSIVKDHKGNLFVGEDGHCIRKIDPAGNVTVFAGSLGYVYGYRDGPGNVALFNSIFSLAIDAQDNLYVSDEGIMVRKIDPDGNVTTYAGSNTYPAHQDGPKANAKFEALVDIAIDASNNLYVTDANYIRKIGADGNVTTIAGSTAAGYVDGPGADAMFNSPMGICVDAIGNIYVADAGNIVIRKITPDVNVSTFAGNGHSNYPVVTGTGTNAGFREIGALTMDATGNLYSGADVICKITPTGAVTRIVGSGLFNGPTGGKAGAVTFGSISGLFVDNTGVIFIADFGNKLITRMCADSVVSVIGGDGTSNDVNGNIGDWTSEDCPVTVTIPVTVTDPSGVCKINALSIPNTFTPNGDNINDTWEIPVLANYPNCTVMVYNRYGQRLYNTKGYSKPWDGTYGGKLLSNGVYYYIIKLDASSPPISGSLTILQ
ncbi:gliding motility-associated C-terminal domain-containing protein [Mucilaginibacter sp. L196]|uniref:T9SS type B sorting domain-containing protein n=1 Tax=Mucilaginibacter sp. L196 TaxID=1641870 RepID=UPI00131E1C03|nr:gliding motility-associated C-terminal domain-containing protein [Mucilaginibacter sp. L196]